MQTILESDAKSTFAKTAKGHDEIASRTHALNARQRRVLILIDGSKSLQSISKMIPMRDLAEIIPALVQKGLVERRADAESANQHGVDGPVQHAGCTEAAPMHGAAEASIAVALAKASASGLGHNHAKEDEKIRQVKDFMTITAQTYLGLLGAEVIHHVERASDGAELMAAIGHWHMALHESRESRRFAAPYLEQVKHALTTAEAGSL